MPTELLCRLFRRVLPLAALVVSVCPQAMSAEPEYRMLWVDIFHPGFRTAGEIDTMLDAARSANYNAVVVQARKACDAYYNSGVEPKNRAVAQDFDPLGYTIQRAKDTSSGKKPLEVHVWLVAYRARIPYDETWRDPRHVFQKHPEWLNQKANGAREGAGENKGRYFLDPGVPQVIDYNLDVVRDLLSNYDVDGISWDYIRYPEAEGDANQWGYNPIAISRFNAQYGRTGKPATNDPQFDEFRRQQITHMVRKVYAHVRAWRPHVKVSAATITWGSIDRGFERTSAYTRIFQDWQTMSQLGVLDIISPMNYKRESVASQARDHRAWANYLSSLALQSGRFGVNMVDGETLNNLNGVLAQVAATRDLPGIAGIGTYSYAETRSDRKSVPDKPFFDTMRTRFYTSYVPVPEATWLTRPTEGMVKGIVTLQGKPADAVQVRVGSQTVLTDGTGFYAVGRLKPGSHRVTVNSAGLEVTREVAVEAGGVAEAPIAVK
jgi:uncharacterized lipoprotein YddW (UPF0748 family)